MNYVFGDYRLDDTRYELRRLGESVAIEPKAFKVLAHLIQHRDRVVTKAELLTRLFPDHAYTFKHALTQEVAYESLLRERRRTLHARIVEVIEAPATDRRIDQIERLAYHALRGEVWDTAVTYFRQAGVQAAMRSANREAVAGFEQALVAWPHLPDTRETRALAIDLRFERSACGALCRHGGYGELFSEALWGRLGAGGRRWLPQGPLSGARHYGQLSGCRTVG